MSTRRRTITALLLAALLSGAPPADAQRRSAATAPTTNPVSTASLFERRITDLESDIGRLMQRRVDDSAGVPRELELRIDVRIVARWMLAKSAEAPAGSEMQACGWIRGNDLLAAALLAEKEFDASARGPGPDAAPAKALRDLTFKLGDAKTVADLDAASRTAALALLTAMGGEATTARLPAMRPPAEPGGVEAQTAAGRRSLDQLAARARELAVSVPLRAQLIAFSLAAGQTARDPKRKAEAEEALAVLDEAVTLAEGLHSNTAVDREDRVRMESQVAQGLAMFLDPRTRALGRKHVAALGHYRKTLARLHEMKLAPELSKRFGPAFAWAQRNPQGGLQVMGAIELFVRQDARLVSPPEVAELSGLAAKASAEAGRRAAAAREAFVAAVPNAFDKPEVLRRQADAFRDEVDAFYAVARAPDALKVLNGYRPRPFGGIDKRVQTSLQAWVTNATDTDRRTAAQFLGGLSRLADYGRELNEQPGGPADDKDESRRRYTNGLTEQFNARRRTMITDVASAVAAGKPPDDAALTPLERMGVVLAAVRTATEAERSLAQADVLGRWVDWGVQRETLDAVLGPYRAETAAAFESLARGASAPLPQWDGMRKRYEPVLALLARVGGRADACAALPPGRTGALAKLVTPLDGQPFATERFARLSLDAWQQFRRAEDADSADAVLNALSSRLATK